MIRRRIPTLGARVPWGLAGMIALVMGIEGFVSHHPLDFADSMSFSWRFSREAARGHEARSDLLCFGDSLVKLGVQPRVLQAGLSRTVYNLAIYGGQASSSFFLLRRALESGARPRAILVDFHPNLLVVAARSNVPYWADLVDWRDGIDLAWNSHDPELLARTAIAWLFPSVKGRHEVRACLLAALRGGPYAARDERYALRRNWQLHGGAHVKTVARLASRPQPHAAEAERPGTAGPEAPWAPRPVHVRYVRRLMELAAAHGITVFWIIPPTTPAWQARRERLDLDGPYTRFVRSMQDRHANLIVIDGRHAGYAESAFNDATHLNRRGAATFSAALAAAIAPHLDGLGREPRWVDLPAFPGRPDLAPREDMALSERVPESLETREE